MVGKKTKRPRLKGICVWTTNINLTQEDWDILATAIKNPLPPNERLKLAAKRYKAWTAAN